MVSTSTSRVTAEDAAGINVTAKEALDWFRKMSLIRLFEERAEEAYRCGRASTDSHSVI